MASNTNNDKIIKKIIRLTRKKAPDHTNFSIYELFEEIKLKNNEREYFKNNYMDIRAMMVNSDKLEMKTHRMSRLTPAEIEKRNHKKLRNIILRNATWQNLIAFIGVLATVIFGTLNHLANNRIGSLESVNADLKSEVVLLKSANASLVEDNNRLVLQVGRCIDSIVECERTLSQQVPRTKSKRTD
ncbi:hypothetical protein L0P88_07790 [Muricauda sp. SCSIO 64092]|uniref:hypothetical protein n=1 Tax=Allomuricauda sp. SCSIO 64092 TaxID=2908842 RepID=UPI001FF292D5|nr:hypothetical protein [Muricauda sp. SCSIO 64092]UOY08447.1 hypothetical protein L0P88_07790 [Muricauda sp. SCSIO 64092]